MQPKCVTFLYFYVLYPFFVQLIAHSSLTAWDGQTLKSMTYLTGLSPIVPPRLPILDPHLIILLVMLEVGSVSSYHATTMFMHCLRHIRMTCQRSASTLWSMFCSPRTTSYALLTLANSVTYLTYIYNYSSIICVSLLTWNHRCNHSYCYILGKYMFLETSAPRKKGDNAIYTSTALSATNGSCLTFWYHMNGNDIGTLNLFLKRAGMLHVH